MKKFIFLLIFTVCAVVPIFAQDDEPRPVRQPEEVAMKQTQMLSRELGLTPEQQDTIYRIHLRYARLRQVSNTRQEAIERMNNMIKELLLVLTPQQREAFLNHQVDPEPRRPQHKLSHIHHQPDETEKR